MARVIPSINTSDDNFGDVFTVVSNIATAFAETITVKANTTGDLTSGNGFVVGTFGAETLVANTIRGGSVSSSSNLTISSNLSVSGETLNISSNVSIAAENVAVGNSTVTQIQITNDGTSANVNIGGNSVIISSNVTINGRSLRIPSGNSSTRPAGVDGLLRHNSETNLLEMYSGGGWKNFISYANTFSASDVSFDAAGNVSSVTIQGAIEELDSEKLSIEGGTLTGNVVINKNGLGLPAVESGTVLRIGQTDGAAGIIDISSFANTPAIVGRRADGINSSKTRLVAGDVIMKVSGRGYDGSSYSNDQVSLELRATQSWTNTAHGTRAVISTTPNGSVVPVDTLVVSSNGTVVNSSLTVSGSATISNDVSIAGSTTLSGNVSAKDGMLTIIGSSDATKKAKFDVSGISSGTTRTFVLPNSNGTIALTTQANTTTSGQVEIATSTELLAGTDQIRALGVAETWSAGDEKVLSDTANIAVSFSSGINFTITLGGNRVLSNPTGASKLQSGYLRIVQDGTGSRTLGYGTSWEFAGGEPFVLSTAPGAEDILFYQVISSTRILLAGVNDIH